MEKGKSYNQRSPGRKSIHFTGGALLLDESEISILINALESASRIFKDAGMSNGLEIRESRRRNSIEDFHSLIRKLVAERKELRMGSNNEKRIDLFRVQIKTINKAIDIYTKEIIKEKSDKFNQVESTQSNLDAIIEKIKIIEIKIKNAALEIRRKNKIKRDKKVS